MYLPNLNARSRVMMFAPHPDDESLAAGVFLQRAVAAGAEVRIVYATDGEKNCWPQRLLERRARIGEADRAAGASARQAEALAALSVLGIAPEQVQFLSLPDQGVTDLLLARRGETIRRLADLILAWGPTHLLVPSASDTHPDHSGLAVLLRFAFDNFLPRRHRIQRLDYLVHGASASFAEPLAALRRRTVKRGERRGHLAGTLTQVAFRAAVFWLMRNGPSVSLSMAEEERPLSRRPDSLLRNARAISAHLQVAFALKPLRAEETSLHLVGQDASGVFRSLARDAAGPPRAARLARSRDGRDRRDRPLRGDAFRAEIFLPVARFRAASGGLSQA